MSRLKTKRKKFKATLADIVNFVDAIFDGDQEMPGWVIMAANAKGRECINALFPQGHIAWRATDPALPEDWRGFNINGRKLLRIRKQSCRRKLSKALI